jgi:hypothetical protein
MADAPPPFVVLGSWRSPEGQAHPYGERYWTRAVDGHAVYFPNAESALGDAHLPAIRAAIAGLNRATFAEPPPPADHIVAQLCDILRARSAVGLAKYNTPLTRTDLSPAAWRNLLQEEMLDGALYLQRLKQPLAPLEALREAHSALIRAAEALDVAGGTLPARHAAELRGAAAMIADDWLPAMAAEIPA